MADNNFFDPVAEVKNRLDVSNFSDAQIYQNLSDPAKFRQAFPEYSHLDDGTISRNMQALGQKVPGYVKLAQPPVPKPTNPIMSAAGNDPGLMTGPQTTGVPGAIQAAARTAKAMNPVPIVEGLGHIFDAPSLDEKIAYKGKFELNPYARPILGAERILGQPLVTAGRAYGPGDTEEKRITNAASLPDILPDALGQSTAQYFGGKAAGEVLDNVLPKGGEATVTPTRTTMLSRALRPGGKAAKNFSQNVQNAFPAIQDEIAQNQGQVPSTLGEFHDLVGNARKRVWSQIQDMLTTAQNTRQPVRGLLPAPKAELQTGVQKVTGEAPSAVLDAESQPANRFGQPPFQSDSFTPLRSEQPPQFLSGGAHPEMSGSLTNPATLLTRDTSALQATRARLASVVNDPETFSNLGPAEQEAYSAQLDRLNKLLEPGPDVPHGPTVDGSVVADAIQKSVRPRTKLTGNQGSVQSIADAYRGRKFSLTQAEELLQDANREASSWYLSKDPHGPQLQASAAAEAQAIRGELYKQIDALTEADPGKYAALKKTYGGLEALQDFAAKRLPVVTRQAPLNLLEGGSLVAGLELLSHAHDLKSAAASPLPFLAAKAVRYANSPDFLIKQALKQPSNVPMPIRAAAVGGTRAGITLAPKRKEQEK